MAGSVPNKGSFKKGEKRPNQGRPKGLKNKNTRDIQAMAQLHGPACIEGIWALTKRKEPMVKLAAFNALLDRGYGKPAQHTSIDKNIGITVNLLSFLEAQALRSEPKLINGNGARHSDDDQSAE